MKITYHLANASTGISYPYLNLNSAASFLACCTKFLASAKNWTQNYHYQRCNWKTISRLNESIKFQAWYMKVPNNNSNTQLSKSNSWINGSIVLTSNFERHKRGGKKNTINLSNCIITERIKRVSINSKQTCHAGGK
jgi:hypothetical protein